MFVAPPPPHCRMTVVRCGGDRPASTLSCPLRAGLWSTWRRPRPPTMRMRMRLPRRPARAALAGLVFFTLLPGGSARPAAPDADAAALPRADRVGLAGPGRRGMARAVGLRRAGAAGGRGGGPPARLLLGRDRAELPPAAVPAGRGDPVRRRRPGVRRDRAAGAGPLLAALGGEARGGLGHRGPAGGGRGRRPRPPVARPAGLARAGRVAPPRGLRAADGGGHALLDPRGARPDRLRLRRSRPGPLLPGASLRARAAAPVRRGDEPGPRGRLGLHPPPPRRLPPRARDGQARAGGGPGRAPGRGGARLPGAVAAQLHDRRRPPPLPLVAHAERGRRGGGLPVGAEAGADPRDLLGGAGGRQPVRPRAAPADLHLPFGGALGPLQRGRPPPNGRAGQRHHGHLRTRPSRGARHAPHARAAPLPGLHPAAAPARRLRRVVGHLRRRREPALLPGPRPGEHRRLARPPLPEEGAVHPDDPLPGPARPRPGGPGDPAGRDR